MKCILTKPCAIFNLEQVWLDAWAYITNHQLYNLKANILQKVDLVLLKIFYWIYKASYFLASYVVILIYPASYSKLASTLDRCFKITEEETIVY